MKIEQWLMLIAIELRWQRISDKRCKDMKPSQKLFDSLELMWQAVDKEYNNG